MRTSVGSWMSPRWNSCEIEKMAADDGAGNMAAMTATG